MIKANKAITLIALIITIIVLLILAGVTINMVLGENGLINKAKASVGKYENAQREEQRVSNQYSDEISKVINSARNINPAGTIDITANGEYDVTNYANVNINVQLTAQQVGTITQQGVSYKFENNGYVIGTISSEYRIGAGIAYIDGTEIFWVPGEMDKTVNVSIYVPKGSTFTTRSGYGVYDLTLFELI